MSNGNSAPPSGGAHDRAEIEAVLERIARRLRELKTFDPSGIQDRWDGRLEGVQKNVNKLVSEAFGMGSALYRQHAIGPLDAALDATFGDRYTMQEFHDEVRKSVKQASARLAAVSKLLSERLEAAASAPAPAAEAAATTPDPTPAPTPAPTSAPAAAPTPAPAPAPTPAPSAPPRPASMTSSTPASADRTPRIALVCRDDDAGEAVTTFVAELGLEPVISLQPQAGASLEALEALRQADFALVLQTDRQLEIGFLMAIVGRQRLRVLQAPGSSDALPGVSQVPMDDGGLWRLLLARDMKQAGLAVDLNQAL